MYEQKQIFIKGEMLGDNVVINRYFELIYNISPLVLKDFINIVNETSFLSKPVRIKKYRFVYNNCICIYFKNKFSSGEVQLSYVLNKNNELFNDMYKILITEGKNKGYFNIKQKPTVKLEDNIVTYKKNDYLAEENIINISDNKPDKTTSELIEEKQINQENIELIKITDEILNDNNNIVSNEIIKPNILFEEQNNITDFVEKNNTPFEKLVSVNDLIKEIMPAYDEEIKIDSPVMEDFEDYKNIENSKNETEKTENKDFVDQDIEKNEISTQNYESTELFPNNITGISIFEDEEPEKESYINSCIEAKNTNESQINNSNYQNIDTINNRIINQIGYAENFSCTNEVDFSSNIDIQSAKNFEYINKRNNLEINEYIEKENNYEKNNTGEYQHNYSIKKDKNYKYEQYQEISYNFDLEDLFDEPLNPLEDSSENDLDNEINKKEIEVEKEKEEEASKNEIIEDIKTLSAEEENISVEVSENKTFICKKSKKISELNKEEKIAIYQNILKGFDSRMVENKLNKLKNDYNSTQKEEKLTLDDVLDAQVELLIDNGSKAFRVLDGDMRQDLIQLDNELYLSKDKIYVWGDMYILDYLTEKK